MKPRPHMRKVEVCLSSAEDITLESIKRMHPEWVHKNGDCPECVVTQQHMADTSSPEAIAQALADS